MVIDPLSKCTQLTQDEEAEVIAQGGYAEK